MLGSLYRCACLCVFYGATVDLLQGSVQSLICFHVIIAESLNCPSHVTHRAFYKHEKCKQTELFTHIELFHTVRLRLKCFENYLQKEKMFRGHSLAGITWINDHIGFSLTALVTEIHNQTLKIPFSCLLFSCGNTLKYNLVFLAHGEK